MNNDSYSYETAGLDNFLSRSIDNLTQVNLDSSGPQSTQMRYDSAQSSGSIGDAIQLGKVKIDGVAGRISVYDDNGNEVIRIGELDD